MHWINLEKLLVIICTVVLSGCASSQTSAPLTVPSATPAAAPTAVPSNNTVCNHQFDVGQQSLQPQFFETETNSILTGLSADTLFRSIANAEPYRGAGNTKWSINWKFDSILMAQECSITNVRASVQVDYHLPLWPDQFDATNRTLATEWNSYSDAIRAHHCKHGKSGIDASLAVKAALQSLPPFSSCENLKAQADLLARSVITRYQEIEAGFVPPKISDYVQR